LNFPGLLVQDRPGPVHFTFCVGVFPAVIPWAHIQSPFLLGWAKT
jgi:hypothetical protein